MGLASAAARDRRRLESDEPLRGERMVRIVVEDSLGRCSGEIVARQFEQDEGRWSRFCVRGHYPVGARGLGLMVAGMIEGKKL